MAVSLTLHQVSSVLPASPRYRVVSTVTSAVGMERAAFVFKTINKEFDHYAYAADMEAWPDNYDDASAAGLMFYRQTSVQRDWKTIDLMQADLTVTKQRMQALCNDMNLVQGEIVVDQTTTITAS